MKIELNIPIEFETDFKANKFSNFFDRALADMNCLCGNYEEETARMLKSAFKNAKEK